ncbi:MAG: lipoyl(octanoyl) transferase LipB [Desulfatirhabdiaceae bacterium]
MKWRLPEDPVWPDNAMPPVKPVTWQGLHLGLMDYAAALDMQHRLADSLIVDSDRYGTILFLEHLPVFTLGKRGGLENLQVSSEFLASRNIPVIPTDRGGNITFHGPGQLIVYPIIHLTRNHLSVVDLVGRLEEVMIETLKFWNIASERSPVNHGVWVDGKKIGSIGIHIRKSISIHGIALNVNNSLVPFDWINPCGLAGITMTSMKQELYRDVPMDQVIRQMSLSIETVFQIELKMPSLSRDESNLSEKGSYADQSG